MMDRLMKTLRTTRIVSLITLLMMATLLTVVIVSVARSWHEEPPSMPIRSSGSGR